MNQKPRFLNFLLVLALIPFFVGFVCPCAMASAGDQTVIQRQPCHGCCPEMVASQGSCEAKLETRQAVKTPEIHQLFFSVTALVPAISLVKDVNVPSAGPPAEDPVFSHVSLFVLNQVFRL